MNVGIGTYLKEDYPEIYLLSKDKENMEESWEEWKDNKERSVKEIERNGIKTIDIIVKL
jgi:hypothetical protein